MLSKNFLRDLLQSLKEQWVLAIFLNSYKCKKKFNDELITKYGRDGLWDVPEFHYLIGSTPGMGGNPDRLPVSEEVRSEIQNRLQEILVDFENRWPEV